MAGAGAAGGAASREVVEWVATKAEAATEEVPGEAVGCSAESMAGTSAASGMTAAAVAAGSMAAAVGLEG